MTVYAVTLTFLILLVLSFRHSPGLGFGILFLLGFIAAFPGVATVLILVALEHWSGWRSGWIAITKLARKRPQAPSARLFSSAFLDS